MWVDNTTVMAVKPPAKPEAGIIYDLFEGEVSAVHYLLLRRKKSSFTLSV
jgi:hypothetical protein